MNRLSLVLFLAMLPVSAFFAFNTIEGLPTNVAVHFDMSGAPDAWISRDEYLSVMMLSLIALPSLLVWLMGWLPRHMDGKGQVPHSQYWFAQERRPATESFLISHAGWLGCFTLAVIYGFNVLVARSNLANPPHLDSDRLATVLLIFLVGLAWWTATFLRRFRITSGGI